MRRVIGSLVYDDGERPELVLQGGISVSPNGFAFAFTFVGAWNLLPRFWVTAAQLTFEIGPLSPFGRNIFLVELGFGETHEDFVASGFLIINYAIFAGAPIPPSFGFTLRSSGVLSLSRVFSAVLGGNWSLPSWLPGDKIGFLPADQLGSYVNLGPNSPVLTGKEG